MTFKLTKPLMKVQTTVRNNAATEIFSYPFFRSFLIVICSRPRLSIFLLTVVCCLAFGFSQTARAQTMSKMYGEVGLSSNYVDKGLTQSNKSISVEAGAGYWFGGQGRIGTYANSVNYTGESANVQLAAFGEYKFIFTPNADLRIRNDLVRYFAEGIRNKVAVLLDQNFFTYHVLLFREDNFEGTKTPRNWFAFNKDWTYSPSVQINATVGYSMVQNYNNYFDTRVGATYLTGNLAVSVFNTYVSAASQFGGRADMAYFLVVAAKF
jgi:uncharacterized protein (TIGR02001 family)